MMQLTKSMAFVAALALTASAQGVYSNSLQKAKAARATVVAGQQAGEAPAAQADPMAPKVVKVAKPSPGQVQKAATGMGRSGRRDPFVSPVVRAGGAESPACSTGKRCLAINQIVVKGIIRSQEGMLALVENASRRAYVLRENDAVFNGQVVRITADSIVFREKGMDNMGREVQREVVKRMTPTA